MSGSDSDPKVPVVTSMTELPNATVHVTAANTMRVQFKIDDLVKKLLPGSEVESSCGGCRGCMGCSMIDFSPQAED